MKDRPIILLCVNTGPRLGYVAKEIFERRLGLEISILNQEVDLPQEAFIISYGEQWGHIQIPFSGQLEKNENPSSFSFLQSDVAIKRDSYFEWTFDLLAISFWMLARMEEADVTKKDEHGRFSHQDSALFSNGNLEKPWIDIWISVLKNQLRTFGINFNAPPYREEWSFDIDNPTAYLHKGLWRGIGGFLKDVAQGKLSEAGRRALCQINIRPDPNDNFDQLTTVLSEEGISATFYVWIGDYGRHDKGLHWKNPYFRKLIRKLAGNFDIGLHPSYRSFQQPERIEMEKKRLEELVEKPIVKNRFHFLRFQVPKSFQLLDELGFLEDHSMGYSKANLFRASTSQPFCFYNYETEKQGNLTIYPFCLMDSASYYSQKESVDAWKSNIWQRRQLLHTLGGRLELVMHNDLTGPHYPLVLP